MATSEQRCESRIGGRWLTAMVGHWIPSSNTLHQHLGYCFKGCLVPLLGGLRTKDGIGPSEVIAAAYGVVDISLVPDTAGESAAHWTAIIFA
eukprot:scaffold157507_cov73-Attheya_sp.AAC.1